MSMLLRLKFWHWTILSIVLGLLIAWFVGPPDFTPHQTSARVTQKLFTDQLNGEPPPTGQPLATNITLYPEHDGILLVTYDSTDPTIAPHFFYSTDPNFPTQLSQMNVKFRYAWWANPAWSYFIAASASLLILGIAWPLLLQLLIGAGLGPKNLDPEYDLSRFKSEPEQPKPKTTMTEADLAKVRELDRAIEQNLAADSDTVTLSSPSASSSEIKRLSAGPLDPSRPMTEQEKKEYEGQFYPVAHPKQKPKGFSLAELLIVIAIIALLIALLLPTLTKSRLLANQLTCAANLRSIGQGFSMYLIDSHGTYPAAYLYVGQVIEDGVETPTAPDHGYIHWSSYLYGPLGVAAKAFQCPSLNNGGLPPCNPPPGGFDPGQVAWPGGDVVDQQIPRLAFTVNEAILPRNKLVIGFQAAQRTYQFVKAAQVTNSAATILATEFGPNSAQFAPASGDTGYTLYTHRPISGFVGTDGTIDMYELPQTTPFRRVTPTDLDPDPSTTTYSSSSMTRLDWVGRNHGQHTTYPDQRRSNFLYADGHVETKTIYQTLQPFQWGEHFWSLVPNNDQQQ